ncbi:MAG: hypothetical protein H5T33_07665 [Candidatus Methanosuratus sp.]|nr:hypothetical protein [Candidatus Methanosuratincola sp.]
MKSVEVDNVQIKENEETLTVPAVITCEGVYDYNGMLIYEFASEVENVFHCHEHLDCASGKLE